MYEEATPPLEPMGSTILESILKHSGNNTLGIRRRKTQSTATISMLVWFASIEKTVDLLRDAPIAIVRLMGLLIAQRQRRKRVM